METAQESVDRLVKQNEILRKRIASGEVYLPRTHRPGSTIVLKKYKTQDLIDVNEKLIEIYTNQMETEKCDT